MKRETRVRLYGILTIIFVLATIGWIIWGVCCCIGNYKDNVYPFSQADSKFTRALGTNNLNVFADYAEEALAVLDGYSGNENWWFPTDNTDMDLIRLDINIIINNSRIAANVTTYGSDAYQEALDNSKESLNVQLDRLGSVESLYWGLGEVYVGLIWGWIILLFTFIIIVGIIGNRWAWYA